MVLLYVGLVLSLAACTVERDEGLEGDEAPTVSAEGAPMNAADLKPRLLTRMQDALERYQAIADEGGWRAIPEGDAVEVGDTTARVLPLRERLAMTGDLGDQEATEQDSVYDQQMAAGVARFQQRHGLVVDSLLGPATVAALNTPVEERIQQLQTNVQRVRELPDSMGTRFVFVNIPEFKLRAFEQGREVLQMPVIVGEAYDGQQTPLFNDSLEYVIFRPYWNVPDEIAAEEIVPDARQDPGYLAENHFEIVSNWGPDAEVLEVNEANLSRVETGELKIRQQPGPENSLGLVKFMMPNNEAIYLHGTPEDHLFQEAARTFSHGCIRVAEPVDLAAFVLQDSSGWTPDRIRQAMNQGDWQQVNLSRKVPVHVLYLTAYVDDSGTVQFREDVYGLIDGEQVAAR